MKSKRSKPLIGNKAVIEADMPARTIPKIPRVVLKPGADPDHVAPHGWAAIGQRRGRRNPSSAAGDYAR